MGRVRLFIATAFFATVTSVQLVAAPQIVVVATSQFDSPVIPDLAFAKSTADTIRKALSEHAGIAAGSIRLLTDGNRSYAPTKKNIEEAIKAAVSTAGAEDSLVVYLHVHGMRSEESGQVVLLTSDSDPRDLESTSVSAAWVRSQIRSSKANQKLVLLDTCYDGKDKSPDSIEPIDAEALANALLTAPDSASGGSVVLIASASKDQQSGPLQPGDNKAPSLFAYWVAKGLGGHADLDRNQRISAREVYDFIASNVERTSTLTFGTQQRQTPLLVNAQAAHQHVFTVVPVEFRKSVRNAAETLSWTLLARKDDRPRIAVMPFTTELEKDEFVNGPYGALSNSGSIDVATAMEAFFRQRKRPVETVAGAKLAKVLAELEFTAQDFRDSKRITSLAERANVNAIVKGRIIGVNDKNQIVFKLQAVDANGNEIGDSVGSVSHASTNTLAMSGASFDTRHVHSQVRQELLTNALLEDEGAVLALPANNEAQIVATRISKMKQNRHPLQDGEFPYRVWLEVDNKQRPITFEGNHALVTVPKYRPFEIHVENKTDEQVMMRLLVDGFNSLPQESQAMPQVHLDEARPWILAPSFHARVPGFVKQTGSQGEYAEFLVVDAARSLASRRKFTQQLGLITAAFYRPKASRRGVGVAPGALKEANFAVKRGYVPGDLLGVVQLRYLEAAE